MNPVYIGTTQSEVELARNPENYRTRNDCGYHKHKQRFGTDVRDGWATKVDFSGDIHV
jgi:thioredoxin reductase (NADPH)